MDRTDIYKRALRAAAASIAGSARSPRKACASRANGRKGGRPRKVASNE